LNDFRNIQLPKRETILSPWLTEGSINMVFADRGIGSGFGIGTGSFILGMIGAGISLVLFKALDPDSS
jgi:hypothetical protein